MDLSLLFAGTGGSAPTARRGLPATFVRRGADKLLFDCGEGTQRQMLRSEAGLPDITQVFLTHHHADHWLGLPGMLKSFDLRDRDEPLEVLGPPGTAALVTAAMQLSGRPRSYDLVLTDLEPGDEVPFAEGFTVHALGVRHRGVALGYALVEDDRPGRFDPDRARELGVEPGPAFGALQRGEAVGDVTADMVVGPTRRGRKVVLSGDTAPCDMVRVAADEADVLVHEATFVHEELARALDTGHSTARQAAELAAEAGVKLLCLTHVSSRFTHRQVRDEARAVFAHTEVPRDFDVVEVPLPEKGDPVLHRAARDRPQAAAAPAP
ncbi:ribonuclease Z [Conexibacter sp. SYSU D00693]|uniref:ribonuclease Z n=1 Tax=Conexibacter sp. SYSU D00693 TaxID=2812560 RepID=UPI00196BAEAA|nr:ribonuclease Z [Conexibacter sp. SYSU D00693]